MNTRLVKTDKIEKVQKIEQFLIDGKGIAVFNNKGINGFEIKRLRNKIRKSNGQVLVVKNTLLNIAIKKQIADFNVKLQQNLLIIIADSPIDALGFYGKFSPEEKKFLSPVLITDNAKYISDNKKLIDMSKMETSMHLFASITMILSSPITQLIKVLDLISKKTV